MNKIEFGDCRETMRRWAAEGVKAQMCVTSPPYFGLRDYGHEGQIGLEETPEQYIAAMVEVFRCVKDVLADDGTLWLNIGDSYARTAGDDSTKQADGGIKTGRTGKSSQLFKKGNNRPPEGIKPKDLIGIPWMLAFALRADGWYLRQDIIWHKPNPMPESVRDRCTKAHEYIFLLSKSERYFFDSEAMKEPVKAESLERAKSGFRTSSRDDDVSKVSIGANERTRFGLREKFTMPDKRNRRSVWTVSTRPYKGAHFATFPTALVDPCILAGSSEIGHCPECGARWVRVTERPKPPTVENSGLDRYGNGSAGVHRKVGQAYQNWLNENPKMTTGWRPSCSCDHDPVPDIVLDPFMGSGTTAQVALQHNRKYLGCELNPEYGALQQERINGEMTLFNQP